MSEPAPDQLPPRRPLGGWWDFMVRGWRPAASWSCVILMLVWGVGIPLVVLARGGEPHFDLGLLGVLLTALKLASDRKQERLEGVTS